MGACGVAELALLLGAAEAGFCPANPGIGFGDDGLGKGLRTQRPILDDNEPSTLMLFDLAVDSPRLWQDQRAKTGLNAME